MRQGSILASAIVCVLFSSIASRSQDKPSIPIPRLRAAGHHKLNAAICKIDVVNKTIRVAPWDGEKWRKDLVMNISWTGETKLQASSSAVTIAQLVKGKPLKGMGGSGKESAGLTKLPGERGAFDIENAKGKLIVRRVDIIF